MSAFDLGEFKKLFESSSNSRADVVNMARVAEAAERYEDMCQFMRYLVTDIAGNDLSVEERNLLSVAYKNVIGTLRASWRTLHADEEAKDSDGNDHVNKYKTLVEDELVKTCEEVLKILTEKLIVAAEGGSSVEASVFYLKMAGDYYRYLAESVMAPDKGYPDKAALYYQKAYDTATQESNPLVATHPIRLGLALNYSVCHYEILKDKKAACELAKKAFDDAIAMLDKLDEADYKDSTLIMQLLRDNLTLWSSTEEDPDVQVEDLTDDEN